MVFNMCWSIFDVNSVDYTDFTSTISFAFGRINGGDLKKNKHTNELYEKFKAMRELALHFECIH